VRYESIAGYVVDDDPARVDLDAVWAFMSTEAYWGRWRTRADVVRQVRGAWRVVGVYHGEDMVGFARAVSDGVQLAYLADVFVHKEHRGHGLGRALVQEPGERHTTGPRVRRRLRPDFPDQGLEPRPIVLGHRDAQGLAGPLLRQERVQRSQPPLLIRLPTTAATIPLHRRIPPRGRTPATSHSGRAGPRIRRAYACVNGCCS